MRFFGSMPALVTPFRNGAIDWDAFARLIDWQIAEGSNALVCCGTTGEASTLSEAEHFQAIEFCVASAAGRVPVIAGVGANNTARAVELTLHAKRVGADAGLTVAPYYNKPNQEGLYAHFMAVADAVALPLFLYNVPGRTVVDLKEETVARLACHPNVIGIKDASGDLGRVSRHRALCGADFIQLSGDDPSCVAFNAQGGVGAISVTANVAPRLCAQLQALTREGRYPEAAALQARLIGLHDAMFASPSPGPAKLLVARQIGCSPELRLPITPPGAEVAARIEAAWRDVASEPVT